MKTKKAVRMTGALLALIMIFALLPASALAEGKAEDKLIRVTDSGIGISSGTVSLIGVIAEDEQPGEPVLTDEGGVMKEVRPAATPKGIYYELKEKDVLGSKPLSITVPITKEGSEEVLYNVIIKFGPEKEEPETPETPEPTDPPEIPEKLSLSFDPNGGSGSMEDIEAAAGEELTLPENSFTAPAGMIFDKWDLGEAGDKLTLTEDTVAKALWRELKTYSVTATYDYNDGETADYSETKTFTELDTPVFTAVEPVERPEYIFKGWGYEGQLIAAGADFTANADLTLTAQWELRPLKTYTIIFDANGGKDAPGPQTGESRTGEVAITLTDKVPTNGEMKFGGWSLSKSEPKPILQPGGVAIVNDQFPTITLYAVWLDPNANPKTGDEADMGLWAALMSLSALSIAAGFYFIKKKHN